MDENRCRQCHNDLCARKVSIFSSLSDDDIIKIISMTGHKHYSKGDFLCREGEIFSSLFIINEGKVKLSKMNREGKEQILRIQSNGNFFGEYYLFSDNEPCNFSATAITDVKICTLSRPDFDRLLAQHPDLNRKILNEISRRLIQTENLAQNLSTNDSNARVAYVLLDLADRYGKSGESCIRIETPISREDMANYAGVTRETISRKLSVLEKSGIIETSGNKIIIVKDREALVELI